MLISQILDLVSCGLSSFLGTGTRYCKFDFKTPEAIILLPKGFSIPATQDFNLEYVNQLVQQGNAIILNGVSDFADATPENTFGTRAATGEQYLTLKNPYMWTFTFDNGLYFHKALAMLESNKQFDIILVDTKGDMLLAKNADGSARGLDLGLLSNGRYLIGNENTETITVQVNRNDFDRNVAWITNENLDFQARDLEGYNDAFIVLDAPATGATSITWRQTIQANGDKGINFQGTTADDYLFTVAGATRVLTAVTPVLGSTGDMTGTFTPALTTGQVLTLQLFDSAENANVILTDFGKWKSNVATTVTV